MTHESATHLLAVLQGQAAKILHSVPARAAYEDIVRAVDSHYGDHQLAVAYWSQLIAKIQLNSESLQEFAAAIRHFVLHAVVGLPADFILWEDAHAFFT
jgi:hypothetical protein